MPCRPTASPALSMSWSRKSAGRTGCPSAISPPAAATRSVVLVGTEVTIVQEGIPDVIPPEACYLGWQESLRNLARLVEPEINQ